MEINSNIEIKGTNALTSAPVYGREYIWVQPSISQLNLSTPNERIIDGVYSIVEGSFGPRHNPDQSWFWTKEWQDGEHRVDEYIRAGNFEEFDTIQDFLATLVEK
jgi:hypothetical protein